jgi:hypothetical protein
LKIGTDGMHIRCVSVPAVPFEPWVYIVFDELVVDGMIWMAVIISIGITHHPPRRKASTRSSGISSNSESSSFPLPNLDIS